MGGTPSSHPFRFFRLGFSLANQSFLGTSALETRHGQRPGQVTHSGPSPRHFWQNLGLFRANLASSRIHVSSKNSVKKPMEVSMAMGVPKNCWFIRENPTKMDVLGISLFQETPK